MINTMALLNLDGPLYPKVKENSSAVSGPWTVANIS